MKNSIYKQFGLACLGVVSCTLILLSVFPLDEEENAIEAEELVEENVEEAELQSQAIEESIALLEEVSLAERISGILESAKGSDRIYALMGAFKEVTRENWREVAALIDKKGAFGGGRSKEWALFMEQLGLVAAADAVPYFYEKNRGQDVRILMEAWAVDDHAAALKWLGENEVSGKFAGAVIRGIAKGGNPSAAIALLETLPIGVRPNFMFNFMDAVIESAGVDGANALFDEAAIRAGEGGYLGDKYMIGMFNQFASQKLNQLYQDKGLEDAVDWLAGHVGQPYVEPVFIRKSMFNYAKEDPHGALDLLAAIGLTSDFSKKRNGLGYWDVVDEWTRQEGVAPMGNWLNGNREHPHYDRFVTKHAMNVASMEGVEEAIEWANTIKDEKSRALALGRLGLPAE